MATEFSLIQALENLYIDPFPTKKYRGFVRHLKSITKILRTLYEVRVCCIDDITANLEINPDEIPENLKNRFIPTAEIYEILTQNQVSQKFNCVLIKLLYYIIIKLNRCTSDDAASILYDFKELQCCVFLFRKYSRWETTEMDEIIIYFQQKLIRMVNEMTLENRELKFHLFSITRTMIMNLGKHPVYSAPTVHHLSQQMKIYYEHVKALKPGTRINAYVFENHLTHLYILNDIIGRNFMNKNKEEGKAILSELTRILNDGEISDKISPRESYLAQNILRIIEVYQLK